jgi:Tol biopolymer transport system component
LPYMAPEQLEGKAADARSDIFAFGAIIYEMITGHPAFAGQSQASLIAAILEHDPAPISTEQPMTPPALDHVVKRCLHKDPADRWQTAHDLTQELKWIAEVVSQSGVATTFTQRKNPQRLAWIVAACAMLLALGLAAAYFDRGPAELRAIRFTISPPEETSFSQESNLDISPDGRHLAFSTFDSSGRTRLWVRPLDSVSAQPLPGSDDGSLSFWSPDGRFIGFFAQGKLKKLALSGGSTQTLCDAPSGWGGTWNRDGVIVFAPNIYSPLYRVSAAGGEPSPVTTLDQSRQETRHSFPRFLPDGRHFLYLVKSTIKQNTGIYIGSLDSKDTRRLLGTEFNAAYAPPGYLLFVRDGILMAQRFDTKDLQMTGEPYPVVQQIGQFFACAYFSISENGVLVYWGGAQTRKAKLVWLDRAGKELQSIGTPGYYRFPSLSPDETRVAVQQLDPQTGKGDIWLLDLLRGTSSRFTFDPSDESSPIWSPDGSRIVFASEQGGSSALCEKSSSGASSEKVLLKLNDFISADDWSSDGRFIAYSATSANSPKTLTDLWVLPLFGERKPILYLQAEFWEMQARLSLDGRWIAYESTESGRPEVYVQSFPALGGKVKVSTQGGADPRWRRDGKELFYVAADHELMAVEVRIGSTFQAGVPKALLRMRVISYDDVYKHYTVSKDGQRFLVVTPTEEVSSNPITVVINWTAELRR